jgi:hypothetical protein
MGASMIDLYDSATNKKVGTITEAELKFLVDSLEEESLEDRDYYIDQATIDLLANGQATDHLLKLLREAIGTNESIDIRWEKR